MGRTRCSSGGRWAGWSGDTPPPAPPLPDEQLQRLADIDEAVEESQWRGVKRAELWRTVWETSVLLAVVVLALGSFRPASLAFALLVVGPVFGIAIHTSGAGRTGCGLLGAAGYLLSAPTAFSMGVIGVAFGGIAAYVTFAVYGLRRESRAYRGWE